jgi:hypothetical protein
MIGARCVMLGLLSAHGPEDDSSPAREIIAGPHSFGAVSAFRTGTFVGAFCAPALATLFPPVGIRPVMLRLGGAVRLWLGVMPLALRGPGQV